MKSLRSILCALIVLIPLAASSEYSPALRLNPDLDAAVRRLSGRYGIPLPSSFYFGPMDVSQVREFITTADSLDKAGELSPSESFQIRQLRELFIKPRRVAGWSDAAQDKSCGVNISVLGSIDPSFHDSASLRGRGTISPSLSGNIGNLSFYSSLDVWTDWYTDTLFQGSDYQPYNGVPYNLYGRADSSHARSSDLPRGGIRYVTERVQLETAIDYLRIGPAVYYPLLLSGNAPPITYARASWKMGPFQYIHLAGELKSQKDKAKFLYLHRLNVALTKNINLGFNEAIVNGSTTNQQGPDDPYNALRQDYYGQTRSWEWAYLIPFAPYKFTEHYLGDRDNALMSFDADVHFKRNFRGYGELLIDDLTSPWTALSSDWGNKWAFTVGGQYFGRFKKRDITATVEYSRVEPWVYTHFYGGSHRYDNFDQCLGMPLGPDADALVCAFEAQISPRSMVGLQLKNTRKDASARGGNISDVFQDTVEIYNNGLTYRSLHPDSPRKHFLGPGTVTSTRLGVSWNYSPFGLFKIDALLEYDFAAGKNGVYGHASGGFVF